MGDKQRQIQLWAFQGQLCTLTSKWWRREVGRSLIYPDSSIITCHVDGRAVVLNKYKKWLDCRNTSAHSVRSTVKYFQFSLPSSWTLPSSDNHTSNNIMNWFRFNLTMTVTWLDLSLIWSDVTGTWLQLSFDWIGCDYDLAMMAWLPRGIDMNLSWLWLYLWL